MNDSNFHGMHCRNCGAEFITASRSADTYCRFCSTPTLVMQDYPDMQAPDLIIPFEIDKAHARQIFAKHLSKRPLTSHVFSQKVSSGFIREIYIPVLLADMSITTQAVALDRLGNERTSKVVSHSPYAHSNLSRMIDDFLFANLSAYNFSKAVAYSEGNRDIPFEKPQGNSLAQAEDEIESVAIKEAIDALGERENISKIVSVNKTDTQRTEKIALLPVWVLSHTSGGFTSRIFINGQNGNIIGEPPVSLKRCAAIFGGIAAGCTLIGELIWMAVNGL